MKKEKPKLPQREETILMCSLDIIRIAEEIKRENPLHPIQKGELESCIENAREITDHIVNSVYPDDAEMANEVAMSYGLDPIPLT